MLLTIILIIAASIAIIYVVVKFCFLGVVTFLNGLVKINYDLGIKEANKQNYLKAIKYFEVSKKRIEVAYKYIYKSIAVCYQNLGINDKAFEYFNLANREDPGDIQTRIELSRYYDIQGNIDKYESEIDSVLDDYPNHGKALYNKSQIQIRKGLFQEAIITLEKLKKSYAIDINISLDLCICYINLGETQLAARYLNEAVKNGFQEKDSFLSRLNTVEDNTLFSEQENEKSIN